MNIAPRCLSIFRQLSDRDAQQVLENNLLDLGSFDEIIWKFWHKKHKFPSVQNFTWKSIQLMRPKNIS